MRLQELHQHLPGSRLHGDAGVDLTAVHFDSRAVQPGSIFVAVPGFHVDGHDYLRDALDRGAVALCVQEDAEAKWRPFASQVPLLAVPDSRAALAVIAAALNGFPARELNVIGVTGTDGKTSLSHLLAHVLNNAGETAGLISTAECRIGDDPIGDSGRFTTPEAPEVQSMLAATVEHGCRWAVVESTSHGLALHRLDRIEPVIAVVTNVGADHLDFHGSVEDYLAAKGRLFSMLDETPGRSGIPRTAVLNADDHSCAYFRGLTSARVLTYGIDSLADLQALRVTPADWGSDFSVRYRGEEFAAQAPSPGAFNVYNALAALAVCAAAGIDRSAALSAIESWPGAPGRMQRIDAGQPFTVVVDFAHAPDSLRRVLGLLRSRTPGRLIVLFGCIGERERDRRPGMGRVAAEMADFTVVTDDNPYTEDRHVILDEIASALRAAGREEEVDFTVVPDRREAITRALKMAQPNDTVLLAGKGHETKVVLPNGEYECDDAAVARDVLAALQ